MRCSARQREWENKACYVPRDNGNGKTRHAIFRAPRETGSKKQEETKCDIQKIYCYAVMVIHVVGIMWNLRNSA